MRKTMSGVAAVLAVMLVSNGTPALAQDSRERATPRRHAPLRIEIAPSGRFYRQCTDTLVIEHRVTGDTIVPRTRCVWAVQPR
jgi:hypothetical protein